MPRGTHPNSIANLKPQKKGDPALNPGGRPKKKWLTEVVEELLAERLGDDASREAYKDQLWAKMLAKGVVSAMTLDRVWERTEGKLTQPVDVSGSIDIGAVLEKWRKEHE